MGPITLTTDFGIDGLYVGLMKGVIFGLNPRAAVIDLSHAVPPQDIQHAARIMDAAHTYFPAGTIHVVVVDPGVGTQRKILALRKNDSVFLAPDNGILTPLLIQPDGIEIFHVSNHSLFRHPVSQTFHGRDIFAPVAAHLSLGLAPDELGPRVADTAPICLSFPEPDGLEDGRLRGEVWHVDRFGNLVTNIRPSDIAGRNCRIHVSGHVINGISVSYQSAPDSPLAIVGSLGYLEIAVYGGSAADLLGIRVGDPISLVFP